SAARSVPLGDRLASLVEHGPARQAHRPGRRATGERCRDRGLLVETRDRATQREPAPTLGLPLGAPARREQVEPLDEDRKRHGTVDERLVDRVPETLRDEEHADEQEKGQREHLDRGVAVDEREHEPRRAANSMIPKDTTTALMMTTRLSVIPT